MRRLGETHLGDEELKHKPLTPKGFFLARNNMKRKRRKVERRRFKRLKIPIPLTIRLLGTTKYPQAINTRTRNVCLEGLSIELRVILKNGSLLIQEGEEPIKLIPFLVLNEKVAELDIKKTECLVSDKRILGA